MCVQIHRIVLLTFLVVLCDFASGQYCAKVDFNRTNQSISPEFLKCDKINFKPLAIKDYAGKTEVKPYRENVKYFLSSVSNVCDASAHSQLNEALKELQLNVKIFTFGHVDGLEPVENLFVETGDENHFTPIEHDYKNDIATIFCSSGTTGPSKCVCLSYDVQLLQPTIYDADYADDIVLSFDSIYWTVGLRPIIDSTHNGVTRIITTKAFSSELQLKLIEKYKVSLLYNPPFFMVACIKNRSIDQTDLSSVKRIFFYGSKMSTSFVAEVKRYFPKTILFSWYGLTELGVIAASILDNPSAVDAGQPLIDGYIVKIVDKNGNRCGPNVNGEVRVKNKNQFIGYLDDPEETAAAVDDDGFFRCGDIGHFKDNGNLFIEERMKNIIRVYGFGVVILPSQIEEYLISLPDILEVCVVGIPIACGTALPAAIVVRKPNSNQTSRDIFNAVAEKFPNRSKLRGGVYFVDELPKTLSGKPLRWKITELATEMFRAAKDSDPIIQSYLSDIPEEFKKFIQENIRNTLFLIK